jgi:hypothetical protein
MRDSNSPDDAVFYDESRFAMSPVASGPASAVASGRPGGLTFICVVAMLLGVLGLLSGCFGIISQVFASGMQDALAGMHDNANLPRADAQKEMNDRLMAVGNRYKWATIPLIAVKIVVESGLLAGAMMALGLKPCGRSWLRGALIAVIVFEVIYAVPVFLIQRDTQLVMSEMLPKMMEAQQGANRAPAGMNDFMSAFASAISVVAIVMGAGWLTAKIVFCALGVRYLGKPALRALFAPSANGTD